MKRLITILAALIVLASSNAFAGLKGDISGIGDIAVAVPTGDFGDIASLGFGLHLYGVYYVADNLGLNFGTGIYYWGNGVDENLYNFEYSTTKIPFDFGGFYEIRIPKQPFLLYFGLDLGLHYISMSTNFESDLIGEVSDSSTEFAFSPKAGIFYPLQDNISLDAGIKIVVIDHASHINIQGGIKYFFDMK